MPNDDQRLVRQCLAGDTSAFDALYDRHAARVFHLLRRLTGNDAEAEDLTQETFLAAYRRLASWRRESAFGTWLCGIAYRLYANGVRRRRGADTVPLEEEGEIAAPESDPLAHCVRHEMSRRIEEAIVALPTIFREAFVLVKVEGLSYREAAEWLDVPLGTLQWRLWRSVCLLQVALGDLVEDVERRDVAAEQRADHRGRRGTASCPVSPQEP